MTDRFIYSLIVKYAKLLIKRQDALNIRLKFASLFRTLPCVELIETSKIEACCGTLPDTCKVMRTKEKIPIPFEGSYGAFIRTVSSIDGSVEVYRTQPAQYTSMTKTTAFKYNKQKYYWYMNGYLYLPNVEWESILLEGIFEQDIAIFTCAEDGICKIRQNDILAVPDDLFAEIEQQVMAQLMGNAQVPVDTNISDKQNILR
ncbi:MAG: hypothetical protein EBU90_06165 [Proteobacteria bacterium]|nr:hypothetical protein [Pseudomonadota bacterium]